MKHNSLPVSGYRPQSQEVVAMVNENKEMEERCLRRLESLRDLGTDIDQRWLAIGRTHLEQAFMAVNRSIFQPERVALTTQENNDNG